MINITAEDDIGISSIFIESNATGVFLNITSINFTSETFVTFSFNETSQAGLVRYKFTVNDTSGQTIQLQDILIDDFDRADSNSLGVATNGNIWNEIDENQQPSHFSFFEILGNVLFSSTEIVNIGVAANATLDLVPILDEDNSRIGFLFQTTSNNLGGTVMTFLQDGENVFTLFSSNDDCFSNSTTIRTGITVAEYCRYNFTDSTNTIVRDLIFEFDFTNRKVRIEVNDTGDVMVNFSVELMKTDATEIDAIQIGPSDGTASSTIVFKYENINFYLERPKTYIMKGRKETKNEAVKIDMKIKKLLDDKQIPYHTIGGNIGGINLVIDIVLEKLNIKKTYKICKA